MPYEIKFGTDGWRAVIADGFTFKNVTRATQAACDVFRKSSKSRVILVGYDGRFFSKDFASTAARVIAANGFKTEITQGPIGSPTLSLAVKERKAAAGVMITASHNPYYFNGFKLKGPMGGSVDENVTRAIEERVDASDLQIGSDAGKGVDFKAGYLSYLKKHFKGLSLKNLQGPLVFDGMHGPGGAVFEQFWSSTDKLISIRKEIDPMFGGVAPEPIETHLEMLKETVRRNKAAAGIAVDGDADRVGAIDDQGRYLPPHTVMPLILLHLIENKKLKGKVIQTLSMGYLPGRIAAKFNLPYEEVPVGFKYIARRMHEEKVLIGGEESGGYGVGLWFPERDGIVSALLLIEMMVMKKKKLSQLVDDLYARFGASHFKRVDFPVRAAVDKAAWTTHITNNLATELAGHAVKSVNSSDGVKIILDDDSWVLMRPSGTEPLIRTYSEAGSASVVDALLTEANRLVHLPPPHPKKADGKAGKKSKKKPK